MSKPKKVILADGSTVWQVYVREGGRGSKEIRRRFPSCKEAQDFLYDFRNEKKELTQGTVQVGTFHGTTFKQESDNWLVNLKFRSSPSHYQRCELMLEEFNRTYGNLEPNKITTEFLVSLQAKLKARKAKNQETTWTNATVNRYTEVICAVLNFAAVQRRIPYHPASGFRKLPNASPEMLFWDEKEAISFLSWANKKYTDFDNNSRRRARKNYIAYLVALNTGVRAGELWGLKPRDLMFEDTGAGDTIHVRRQFSSLTQDFALLKGGASADKDKSRHVPCSKGLRKELEELIRFNKIGTDKTVFQSVFGNPVNHASFVDRFDRDMALWGGRRIRFHDLRHSAATLMLAKGIDVKTVSEILGHEDISTTMIYVHLLGDKVKQVSKFFSVGPTSREAARPQPN